jgi:ParB family chromosome partitioning protein
MSKKKTPPKRLGRGLDVLLDRGGAGNMTSPVPVSGGSSEGLKQVSLRAIQPNRWQPRLDFDENALKSLADSIKESGLMQPVVLREGPETNSYELVAGERRWRAAGLAGLAEIPAMVRQINDQEMAAFALVENLQREDLNALEQALALNKLILEFGLTHERAAQYIGQTRSAVSNLLRLLELPEAIQAMMRKGALQMGHCRAMLSLPAAMQIRCASLAVKEGWSVRQIEEWVLKAGGGQSRPNKKVVTGQGANSLRLERTLADHLGAPVSIQQSGGDKGKILIRYGSNEELEGILQRIGVEDL